jgi:hypothetical protein
MISFLQRAWRGEERLWKVWWLLGTPLAMVNRAIFGLLEGLAEAEYSVSYGTWLGALVLSSATYFAWCNMAWGCAKNVDRKIWGHLAKLGIVLGILRMFIEYMRILGY